MKDFKEEVVLLNVIFNKITLKKTWEEQEGVDVRSRETKGHKYERIWLKA